jgi:PKD repeat protein
MKNIVLAASLAIFSFSGLAQAQTFPDFGHALAGMGYTRTIWVNGFSQPHLAHGVFYPNNPIDPSGNYEARYGMALTGSGTLTVDPTTLFYIATGTAHNPNAIPSDGSLSIDLLSKGNLAEGGSVIFNCPASSDCPWTMNYQFAKSPLPNPSLHVYRHVEGSVCGGELSIDLNADCHDKLVAQFNLPAAYHFTPSDTIDTNYVSTPGASTTVLCAVIRPLCIPVGPIITVSGNNSGKMNQPYVYSGSAANCTPNPTGWTWTTGDGSITGAATGSSVTVSWPTNGQKVVTATNSGCSGAQGSQSVNIGDGAGCVGGNLQAQFTFSPAAPRLGVPVSFDSSPSTCVQAGASFDWTFGDSSSGTSGPTATHVYNVAGIYTAQLTITPVGCLNTACLSTATHQVPVSGAGAQFIVTPNATQEATFDASSSTNIVAGSQFGWDFGDGGTGSGTIVLHTYVAPGSYKVVLTITPPGCTSAGCKTVASNTVVVGPAPTTTGKPAKLYLLGVLTGAQAANTTWQTDLLLANTGDQAVQTALTFTGTGGNVKTAQVAVPAGSTTRLENVLVKQFSLTNATGVLTLTSTSPNGVFPIASAEVYDNTNPAKRYGESLVAMSDADAADLGKKEVLVGLRQDGSHKTTLWVFNPSTAAGVYDVVYRGLDGTVLGTLPGIKIAANRLTQLSPAQHPINKTTGVPNGFTVEVVVKSGKALAAAQVVNTGSNDPAYIAGEVR